MRNKRLKSILAGLVGSLSVIALIAGVAVPSALWVADRKAAAEAAREDAAMIVAARNEAVTAEAEFDADVQLALVYVESAAVPARDLIAEATDDFGQEHADAVSAAVDDVTEAMALQEGVADAPAPELRTAEYLEPRYLVVRGERRDVARAAVASDVQAYAERAHVYRSASDALRHAVDATDETLAATAAHAAELGSQTHASLQYASADALATLQSAIDGLNTVATAELPLEWADRSPEQASPFGDILAAMTAYRSAVTDARASHTENTPRVQQSQRRSGGSHQLRLCPRYSAWGGMYLGWCRR